MQPMQGAYGWVAGAMYAMLPEMPGAHLFDIAHSEAALAGCAWRSIAAVICWARAAAAISYRNPVYARLHRLSRPPRLVLVRGVSI